MTSGDGFVYAYRPFKSKGFPLTKAGFSVALDGLEWPMAFGVFAAGCWSFVCAERAYSAAFGDGMVDPVALGFASAGIHGHAGGVGGGKHVGFQGLACVRRYPPG